MIKFQLRTVCDLNYGSDVNVGFTLAGRRRLIAGEHASPSSVFSRGGECTTVADGS